MKLLTFQARHFTWKPFSKTLEDASEEVVEGAASDAVVARTERPITVQM